MAALAVTVAIFSLAVSAVTAWLTLFRRGTVRMTQPTVIFFGPEPWEGGPLPKVYLRTLLFATSKRGRVIESMHVTLALDGARRDFSIWVYGERAQVVRGSGLFVGETGIAANHHFLIGSDNRSAFAFTTGRYELEVHAHLLGDRGPTRLFWQELRIPDDGAAALAQPMTGIYFDWDPSSAQYAHHIDRWRAPLELQDVLGDQPQG